MTEHDPFEQELQRVMTPRSAPTELQRRIARIPWEHARPAGAAPFWRRWMETISAPWAASMSAALASLAVGFWLGFSGLVQTTGTAYASADDDLASLVFESVPTAMGGDE